jgi:hypothetical protein
MASTPVDANGRARAPSYGIVSENVPRAHVPPMYAMAGNRQDRRPTQYANFDGAITPANLMESPERGRRQSTRGVTSAAHGRKAKEINIFTNADRPALRRSPSQFVVPRPVHENRALGKPQVQVFTSSDIGYLAGNGRRGRGGGGGGGGVGDSGGGSSSEAGREGRGYGAPPETQSMRVITPTSMQGGSPQHQRSSAYKHAYIFQQQRHGGETKAHSSMRGALEQPNSAFQQQDRGGYSRGPAPRQAQYDSPKGQIRHTNQTARDSQPDWRYGGPRPNGQNDAR